MTLHASQVTDSAGPPRPRIGAAATDRPSLPSSTGVLIVGAGPTGLTLAARLASQGVPFVILDKRTDASTTSRGAVIHARTVAVLDGLGLADPLLEEGVIAPRFTMRRGDRAMLSVSFADLPGKHRYSVIVPQNVTEQLFRDHLAGTGNPVYDGFEVIDLPATTDTGTVVAVELDGHRSQIAAQYVVGCDGRNSRVRELTGIAFSGATYQQRFAMADVTMDWPLSRDGVDLFLARDGLMVVFPLPADRFRIIATADPGVVECGSDGAANASADRLAGFDVQRLLDTRGPVAGGRGGGRAVRPLLREVHWSSHFSIENRLADAFRSGSVFLAGDSAHVYSPAGGQGMNLGIRDAAELGGVLADVLDGRRGPDHLDCYEARRRPLAQQVVALTDRMTKAVTTVSPVKRIVRNAALTVAGRIPAVPRAAALTLSGYREPTYDELAHAAVSISSSR